MGEGLERPETHEDRVLSRDGAAAAGGVSEFGSWCGTQNWGNQDGSSITTSTLVSVPFAGPTLATERRQHSSQTDLFRDKSGP